MRRLAVAAALFAAAVGTAVRADDADKELKKLEGVYAVKALTKGGKDAPKEVRDAVHEVSIKGDVLAIEVKGEGTKKAKIKVDPAKKPARIDITPQDGPDKDKTFPGVYKLEKGQLTLVFTEKGDRPKDFKTEGEDEMKLVLTRKDKDE